uniref:Vesicle transport protein n=1 Tax=Aegilops tauschii subsp. strangulata TaxID=200361 RepID=A0A453HJY2_AEGTS
RPGLVDPSHLSLRAALHRIPASYRILPSQVGCKSVYGDYIARLARCYFSGQPRRRMAGRARATGIRGNSGDGPKKRQREEMSLNRYAAMQAYLLMGVTGLGYLALLWSTVVLLGGFVTALGKKDFWCLTAISMIQAARSVMSCLLLRYSPSRHSVGLFVTLQLLICHFFGHVSFC